MIEFVLDQTPDVSIDREFSILVTDKSFGEEIASPDFIALIGTPETTSVGIEQVLSL